MALWVEREEPLVEQHVDRLTPGALDHELGAGLAEERRRVVDELTGLRPDAQVDAALRIGACGRPVKLNGFGAFGGGCGFSTFAASSAICICNVNTGGFSARAAAGSRAPPHRVRAHRQIAHCRRSGETSPTASNGRSALRSSRSRSSRKGASGMKAGRIAGLALFNRRSASASSSRAKPRSSAQAAITPGLARRAAKSAALAPWRAATSAGMSVGADPALNGSSLEQAGQRQRHAGGRMRVRRIEILSAGRDSRREPQPRALALVGEGAKSDEVEIVLRRDLLQARVQHRLEPGARQRVGVDRRAKRERDRVAGRFGLPFAGDRFAPPGEPYRRQIGIARALERVTDFVVEARQSEKRAARVCARIERAEPLIASVSAGERGAMLGGVRERVGARRTARRHGAAISAAATRRPSDCMTL